MKKILAILLVAVLLSTAVFAQIEPVVNAQAVLTWGVDLGQGKDAKATHGFENKLYAKILFPIYSGSFNTEKDSDVYIDFNIDANLNLGTEFNRKNETAGDEDFYAPFKSYLEGFHASLHFFGAYITVYDRPDFYTNFAKMFPWLGWSGPWDGAPRSAADADITGFGTKIGYKSEDLVGTGLELDTGLKFASNGAWYNREWVERDLFAIKTPVKITTDNEKEFAGIYVNLADGSKTEYKIGDTVPVGTYYFIKEHKAEGPHSKYALGYDLDLAFKNYVYFNFAVNMTIDKQQQYENAKSNPVTNYDAQNLAMGFKVGSKAVEGLDISLGMDAIMNTGTEKETALDIALNGSYKWVHLGIFYGNKHSEYTGYNKDAEKIGDLAMRIAFMSGAAEDDPTNFVNGLGFGIDFRLQHLLNYISSEEKEVGWKVPMGFKLWVNYKAEISDSMWIKPYFNLWGETNSMFYADDTKAEDYKAYFGIAYNVGVTFSPMEKVEIFLDWKHGKVRNRYVGLQQLIAEPCQHKNHNGTFTMGMKLIY